MAYCISSYISSQSPISISSVSFQRNVVKETRRTRASIEIWEWRNGTPNEIDCTKKEQKHMLTQHSLPFMRDRTQLSDFPWVLLCSLSHWSNEKTSCNIMMYEILRTYCRHDQAIFWKWMQLNEHYTTRVLKALLAKGNPKNLKVCFWNISVQVKFYWYQTSVCWNISVWH